MSLATRQNLFLQQGVVIPFEFLNMGWFDYSVNKNVAFFACESKTFNYQSGSSGKEQHERSVLLSPYVVVPKLCDPAPEAAVANSQGCCGMSLSFFPALLGTPILDHMISKMVPSSWLTQVTPSWIVQDLVWSKMVVLGRAEKKRAPWKKGTMARVNLGTAALAVTPITKCTHACLMHAWK